MVVTNIYGIVLHTQTYMERPMTHQDFTTPQPGTCEPRVCRKQKFSNQTHHKEHLLLKEFLVMYILSAMRGDRN